MIIETLEEKQASEWDAYVERHADSTCYHLRGWRTVAEKAYRLHAPYLVARQRAGAPICGALPLFVVPGPVRSHVTNGLFGAYGAVLADDDAVCRSLLREAKRIFERRGASHLMLKCTRALPDPDELGLEPVDSWVTATLSLDRDPDRIWDGLRNKIRNCVRKARRFGLELRAGPEQLDAFYDVLSENMHQKGAPVYGRAFMRQILVAMEDRAEVLSLWQGGRVVSGALVIDHRDTAYVPFASSRPSALHMSPNNLLYWEIIRRACLRGARTLDFGRSLRESGPLAFKLGWGAVERPQASYLCSSRGKSLRIDPGDRRVDWFVRQWKRLPRPVANAFGPAVCRQLAGLI